MARYSCPKRPDIALASRRDFLQQAATRLLGVTAFASLPIVSARTAAASVAAGRAQHVIYLNMKGAMSHLETFDPKPGTDATGETSVIDTKLAGIKFGSYLPKLASMADRLAIIRSLTSETGAHEPGQYLMRTAYRQINSIRHPGLAAWDLHVRGKLNEELPGSVLIGNANDHPTCGFLDPGLSPVPVANPERGLENTKSPGYLVEGQFERRLQLADRFDSGFRSRYRGREVEAYNQMYKDAVRLMHSPELSAFDLSNESEKLKEAYGKNTFGQGCLLARRLIEHGVRFIEVESGGWDMHNDLWTRIETNAGEMDQGMGALLDDLHSSGLIAKTLVVLATEFGRTPEVNANAGRDHHPGAFSCVLAGAGVRSGVVYGATDETGMAVDEDNVSLQDFNATIAAAMGLPLDKEFIAPNGRPFVIADHGTPIAKVLA